VVEIANRRLEDIEAAALLLPVDGALCRLGGAAASALRAALSPDERADELEYVEHELAAMRPLTHPEARAIDGVARWSKLVVSAAYPHDVDGVVFSPDRCAQMVRAAIPEAIATVARLGLGSIAAASIGTAYRIPSDLAVRAFVDGLAAASHHPIAFRWALIEPADRELARAAAARVGLTVT